jgi:hypothetical protein
MKDIMQKLAELEATAPKVTKKKMLNEDSTTPPMNVSNKPASLKDVFAALSENVVAGQRPIPVLDPQNKQAGMGFVTSNNPAVQNMLKALDPKDVQIVQAPGQPGQQPAGQQQQQAPAAGKPNPNQLQSGQQAMREEQLDEISTELATQYIEKSRADRGFGDEQAKLSWKKRDNRQLYGNKANEKIRAGQGKVSTARVGTTEGAKVDRMVKHIEKSEKKLGKSKGEAEDIAWATANKRGMLDNKNKKKVKEGDIAPTSSIDTRGAGLGAGRSRTTLEGKKPDFLDLDKDGNKKEPMKKAAADKKKKKVDESMNHRISAARFEGKAHGLKGHAHCGKSYEDLGEMKAYHEGYKEGLDECYGQGVYETAMPATVPGMASAAMPAMEDEMGEGNAFTKALADTPRGGKFTVGGKTFTDRTSYDAKLGEYAFESADLDEAIGNPIGAVARELRGLKGIAKDTPYGQMPGATGAAAGAATGIAAAATMGAGAAAFLPIVGAAALGGWGLMKAGQLTGKVLNYLAQKVFGTKEEALEFAKAHLEAARNGEASFQHNGKTYKVSLKPGQISQLYSDIEQLSKDVKDKAFDKRMAPDTAMGKLGSALKEDPVFESLDKQLNALLNEGEEVNEGLSVSISKGQQNSPDSVTITAQDEEAEHLLAFVKNAGLGLFGDDHDHSHSSAMSIQPAHGEPDEVGAGGVDVEVVDGNDGIMGLMQKLSGIQAAGADDYEDEEGDEEQLHGNHEVYGPEESPCNECGMMECDHGGRSTNTSQDSDTTGNATVSEENLDEFLDISTTVANKGQSGDATGSSGGASSGAAGGSSGVSGVGATGGASDATASNTNKNQQDAQAAAAANGNAGTGGSTITREEESEDQMEFEVSEDNAPDSDEAETSADEDAEAKEDAALAGEKEEEMNESDDEEDVSEGFTFEGFYKKLAFLESTEKEDEKAEKAGKKVTKDIEYDDKKDKKEKIDEWANEAGKKGTDASFEADIDFMTKVIAGGLNKPKSTGQTTVPVIAGQENRMHDHQGTVSDSIDDWTKLAGIK